VARPRCYNGACERKARKGSMFCTDRCAVELAEELAAGSDDVFCVATQRWEAAPIDECVGCGRDVHECGAHLSAREWIGGKR
jgi:hypothetical protein